MKPCTHALLHRVHFTIDLFTLDIYDPLIEEAKKGFVGHDDNAFEHSLQPIIVRDKIL